MPCAEATDGTRIAFDDIGAGEPVVLLAGQANSRGWWDPIRGDFAAHHRTIAVDAVGTGGSDEPRDGRYDTRRFAADVVAVLDALGVGKAHVYGTSMGGKVAQWVAVDHPDRVGALVLGCTSPGGEGGLVAERDVVRPLRGAPAQVREALVDLMFTPEYARAHSGPFHVLGARGMSPSARRGHRRASEGHDAWDELGRIRAPTLVLHGSADLFCPVGNAERIASRIPGAEVSVIDGARHAYFEEFREQASAAVLSFLARHPLDAG
ncbi:alpha/beta fold hydrolase [Saccharothrix deserti]|uniref:alpha/beta fold hydrolase n=1 Tax=Saccharothrix deserti TaxID=2593674 RepID=UPI00131E31E2|nr:alpha/beta fold hydrolase [Saccharothrix deserti]